MADGPVMRTLSDEALLAGLGSGDPDAAAAFVDRFQRRVFGMTLSVATVHLPAPGPQRFDVQLITRDGRHLPAGSAVLGGTHDTWGARIPTDLSKVTQLRFVAADGRTAMIAYLNAHGAWGPG